MVQHRLFSHSVLWEFEAIFIARVSRPQRFETARGVARRQRLKQTKRTSSRRHHRGQLRHRSAKCASARCCDGPSGRCRHNGSRMTRWHSDAGSSLRRPMSTTTAGVSSLGVARTIARKSHKAERVASELKSSSWAILPAERQGDWQSTALLHAPNALDCQSPWRSANRQDCPGALSIHLLLVRLCTVARDFASDAETFNATAVVGWSLAAKGTTSIGIPARQTLPGCAYTTLVDHRRRTRRSSPSGA